MKIMSNIPEIPMMITTDYKTFKIGDRVRVQFVAKKYPEYPYSGGGVIGHIKSINYNSFVIDYVLDTKVIEFDDIYIIKKVDDAETFDTVPNINDEEREFWRTHWITKDGIKKKTAEDSKMLEEFNKELEEIIQDNLLTRYKF